MKSDNSKGMIDIVVIGGCGRVGLPLSLSFARCGKSVCIYDIDRSRVDCVNSGKMPFRDHGADALLPRVRETNKLWCTTDPAVIGKADVVIVVIGTPVDEHLNPHFDVMQELIRSHRDHFRPDQLLILRSTIYPGTTERLDDFARREGVPLDVAFCPERVAQGHALEEISVLPQIVAGCNARAQKRAENLFKTLGTELVPMKPIDAELTKLFTNSWRYIQFAVANQFYMIANEHGADFYEIHRAMTHNYPRAQGFPRAGFAAGPCLFKDTMQLSAFHNNSSALGFTAMLINEGLPNYLAQRAARRFPLRNLVVGILGMTFKGDCDDTRDSLSFKLRRILQAECRQVICTDPYLTCDGMSSLEEVLERAQVLFVGAPHTIYKSLNLKDRPVVDIWNITQGGTRVS